MYFSLCPSEPKGQTQPLDLAPPVDEDEELTPEEVQMVGKQYESWKHNNCKVTATLLVA